MTVFFAVAVGSTAYAGWTAHRKGVDVRGDHTDDSWPAAAIAISGYGLGFGVAMRFFAAWPPPAWMTRLYKHIQAQGFTVGDITKYV